MKFLIPKHYSYKLMPHKHLLSVVFFIISIMVLTSCSSGNGMHVFTPSESLRVDSVEEGNTIIPEPVTQAPTTPETSETPVNTLIPAPTFSGTGLPFLEFKQFRPEEKTVCITFDDGPYVYTNKILEKLEGTDSKVTFFVVGKRLGVSSWASATKKAIENGHEIGFHSYGHEENYTDLTDIELMDQIRKTNEYLTGLGGKEIALIRPVGGVMDRTKNYGYPCILWNVDPEDWRTNSSIKNGSVTYDEGVKLLAEQIVKKASSGSIILLHDLYECSVDAFILAYDKLTSEGYKFVTVSEMLGLEGKEASGYAFYSSYTAYYLGERCS